MKHGLVQGYPAQTLAVSKMMLKFPFYPEDQEELDRLQVRRRVEEEAEISSFGVLNLGRPPSESCGYRL